jgi:hypothetical protein
MHDSLLDRFDRLILAGSAPRAGSAASTPAASSSVIAGVSARPVVPPTEYITSKRGPRFVDHTGCPHCSAPRVGLEYQGVRANGAKMHTLAAHSPGRGNVPRGMPRCAGVGAHMTLTADGWAVTP